MGFLDKYASQILGITRIVAGLCFLEHGTMKLLGFPPGMHPPLISLAGAAGVIELVTGVLIVLGLYSRTAAFIASGEMAFAYFLGHFPRNFFPANNGGDAAILFCFLFLYLAAAGPGAFSVNKK
ncbi:MAG TPA: DoxX family protein [Rhizomicrobium sp.]|jgi:putative oxidoreductase|nr:DoxX family protein [Rhizomicrobium sp.]